MTVCVRIDVAKHTLEWSAGPEGKIEHTRNEPRPIAALVRRMIALEPEGIVIESTGGDERKLVLKLAEAALRVVVVNPRGVRSFGQGRGIVAKNDAIDARLVALFGEKVEPPVRPMLQGTDRLLADLVARRRYLRELEQRLDTMLRQDPDRSELLELLQTVLGAGPAVARTLLIDLPCRGYRVGSHVAVAALLPRGDPVSFDYQWLATSPSWCLRAGAFEPRPIGTGWRAGCGLDDRYRLWPVSDRGGSLPRLQEDR